MLEYGKPAEWANGQKWKRRGKSVKSWAAAIGLIVLGLAAIVGMFKLGVNATAFVIVSVVLSAIIGAVVYKMSVQAKSSWKRASQARIGVESERKVRRVVRRRKPFLAMYGVTFGNRGGDCDLVVVTPELTVASVEIKTGFGKVSMYGNHIRAGRKTIPRDPVGQCMRNTKKLEHALGGVMATAIICIPGMTNAPFKHQGVLVCSTKDMFQYLRRNPMPAFQTGDDAKQAFDSLWKHHLAVEA